LENEMAKSLRYRAIGASGLIVPTPLYVSDGLLAEIVLGEEARSWPDVRRVFQRQGMPAPRSTVCGLYYLPAILKFLARREGLTALDEDYPDDGPDNFGP
jgi:hypothetical protein